MQAHLMAQDSGDRYAESTRTCPHTWLKVLEFQTPLKAQAYVNKSVPEELRLSGNLAASVQSLICPAPANNTDWLSCQQPAAQGSQD